MNLTYEYLEQNYDIVIEHREDKYEADLMAVLRGAAAIDVQEPMSDDDDFADWLKCNCERISIDGPQLLIKARLASSLGSEYDVTDDKSCKALAFDYEIYSEKDDDGYFCYKNRFEKSTWHGLKSIKESSIEARGTLHQAVYGVIAQLSTEEHQYSN